VEPRLEGREKPINRLLVGNVDRLVGVGEEEGIQDHHDRKIDPLGQTVGLEGGVEHLLAVLAVELIHPVSRCARLSVWSAQMFHPGPERGSRWP